MKLLSPITIRGVELKNRMVMPPMQVGVGVRSPKAKAYYMERAKGGVGTIIMAAISVDVFATDDAWGRAGGVDKFLEHVNTEDFDKTFILHYLFVYFLASLHHILQNLLIVVVESEPPVLFGWVDFRV